MAKTAFIFPGQASQFVGMGMDLYNQSEIATKLYDYAEQIFNFSLKEISFYGPIQELTKTVITQPAIFVNSIVIFEELKAKGYLPDMVAGHSLGEYSALVAAGVLTFETGLELVKIRAEQMQIATENNAGTMAAIVGMDFNTVKKILDEAGITGVCEVANHNSPIQVVISGDVAAVQTSMLELKNAGAKRAIELTVGGAFHSPLMSEAGEKLKDALDKAEFKAPICPIYSNVTGTSTDNPEVIRERLYQQLTCPVLWVNTIDNMISDGAEKFIEVGPGKVLQGLVKRISNNIELEGVSSIEDLEKK